LICGKLTDNVLPKPLAREQRVRVVVMEPGGRNSLAQYLKATLAVLAVGAIAYLAFQHGLIKPQILGAGSVKMPGGDIAPTRRIFVGGTGKQIFWQVQLSDGSWVDCLRDCAQTAHRYEVR
jgi:hypothetical protein